ncbi:MAG: hypothetical protein ABW133_19495 [Polyangiaceae bacterium]
MYEKNTLLGMGVLCLGLVACGGASDFSSESSESFPAQAAGATAVGAIPAGLPARVEVGLFEGTGKTWMKDSAVPWDMRYQYFTKGWIDNWGWGNRDGKWGLDYMRECDAQRFIPVVQYYQMNDEAGGGEGQFLAKAQNAATMQSYFGDFKILMQRAKEFGKPVVVLLEADGYGLLQQQSSNNPNAYAAIKDSGLAELSGLPNTVAGWGLAFLQLRKAVGANNAILGIHISGWASGKDVAYFSVTDPLSPEVDKVHAFLAPLGVGNNVTGSRYDVLVGDPLDRDSEYYRVTQSQDRWWDASDSASISSKSFNRYAEWLRLWNVKAGMRWILWQIPLGNSNHTNVYNNGASREGYKDNRPEYFFGNGTAHIAKFAESGVIGLLFGAGAGGQSSFQNDTYTDGQLFMKSRAGAILRAGGVPLSGGSGGSDAGTGTPSADAGTDRNDAGGAIDAGNDGASTPADSARYNFETGNQSWVASGAPISSVASSATRSFAGAKSLAVTLSGAGAASAFVRSPTVSAGNVIAFRVFVPSGNVIASIQPYVLQGAAGGWAWTGAWRAGSSLTANAWNTISVTVPSNAKTPLDQIGVEFTTNAGANATAYVDSVTW